MITEKELIRPINLSIGNITINDNCILLCGNINTKIRKYIKNQIDSQDPYLYDYTNKNKIYSLSTYELAKNLSRLEQIIDKRAFYVSNIQNNRNYQKLLNSNEYIRPNVIMIDDLSNHIESDDYKSVETIRITLKSIIKNAKKSNSYLIVYSLKENINRIESNFDTIINFNTNAFTHIIQEDEIEDNIEEFDEEEDNDDFDEPAFIFTNKTRDLKLELEDSRFDSSNTSKDKKDIWIKYYRQARNSSRSNVIVESIKNGKFTITNDDKVLILPDIN